MWGHVVWQMIEGGALNPTAYAGSVPFTAPPRPHCQSRDGVSGNASRESKQINVCGRENNYSGWSTKWQFVGKRDLSGVKCFVSACSLFVVCLFSTSISFVCLHLSFNWLSNAHCFHFKICLLDLHVWALTVSRSDFFSNNESYLDANKNNQYNVANKQMSDSFHNCVILALP